jgi:hypothetical protein
MSRFSECKSSKLCVNIMINKEIKEELQKKH